MLNRVESLNDLRMPPGNRLEGLRGLHKGQHSLRINEIVHGKRRVTADWALRLSKCFDMSPQFWLGLQMDFDLDKASPMNLGLAHRAAHTQQAALSVVADAGGD